MNTIKLLILITPIFFLSFKSEKTTWKEVTPFEHLVYQSELIVNGRISKLNKETYLLEISKVLKGDEKICVEIEIEKWHEWPCEIRSKEYELGQEFILFLKKSKKEIESWKIINGSTGEKLIKFEYYLEYPKNDIYSTINLVQIFFEKVNEWKSKINCSSMILSKKRYENTFFDYIVLLMEMQDRIET